MLIAVWIALRLAGRRIGRCWSDGSYDLVADSSNSSRWPARTGSRVGADPAGFVRNGSGRVAKVGADVADLSL